MEVKQILQHYKHQADLEIENYFSNEFKSATEISPYVVKMTRMLRDYTQRGGKRLRAALVYYSYNLFKESNEPNLIKTSIFIELIHSYLLILDDIMDRDSLRRGFPTLHIEYKRDHKKNFSKGSSSHFGVSMAINTACMAVHKAINILAESDFPTDNKLKAIIQLQKQIDLVAQGQALDILGEVKDKVTEADIIQVHTLKTAVYTYETPICIGAILAGATEEELETLRDYSIPAGIAFQLQDDHIGLFGTEEEIGKNVGSDIKEGKSTLLIVKALELCTPTEKEFLITCLGNKKISEKDINRVRKIVIQSGALEYSKNLAEKYVKESQKALLKMKKFNSKGINFLEQISEYMINRNH